MCTVLEQRICHRVLGGFRSHLWSAALGKWKLWFFLIELHCRTSVGPYPTKVITVWAYKKHFQGSETKVLPGAVSLLCLAAVWQQGLLLETSPVAIWEVALSPCVSSVTGTPQTQARSLPRGPDSHCMGGLCSVTSEGCGGETPGSNTSNQNRSETYLRLHLH